MTACSFPLVRELPYQDPCQVFSQFSALAGSIFLDSAQLREACGRYSFIGLDPFQVLSSKNGFITKNGTVQQGNPFEMLQAELNRFSFESLPDLPPFQGGAAGYLGYELAQHLEKLPLAQKDLLQFPDLMLGFYDVVLGFDLLEKRAWIFSSGFPCQTLKERYERAEERLQQVISQLEKGSKVLPVSLAETKAQLVRANFSPAAYEKQVQKVIEYILAGDIFEANLAQHFSTELPPEVTPFELYRRLRTINPAPFAAYLHFKEGQLASASPERFLKVTSGWVETRPIKGTRPRGQSLEEDKQLAVELQHSEKDRAENVMIVDLLRNDLSRVCEAHSVKVPQLCGLESYPTVHHLVSVVIGKLRADLQLVDLLKATFPGGSITGAPKLRAMEIIAELEPTQRGPYCGSVVYLGFDGRMDSSIIIRSFSIKDKTVSFQAGGAVVADSEPKQEREEVLTKARALFKALGSAYDFAY